MITKSEILTNHGSKQLRQVDGLGLFETVATLNGLKWQRSAWTLKELPFPLRAAAHGWAVRLVEMRMHT